MNQAFLLYTKDKEERLKGNYLRQIDFNIMKELIKHQELLPYPTHVLKIGEDICEEYEIPEDKLKEVLVLIHPYQDSKILKIDNLNQKMLSLSTNKIFLVKQCRIIRFDNCNFIVSPWFEQSGETLQYCIKVD